MVKATIDNVAALAGVSIKTVSRVVNREPNVRDSTREAVEAAIAQLNYKPNQSARNLASRRSHLMGLVYDDPSNYQIPSSGYVIELQQGLLHACKSAKYDLVIHPCDYTDSEVRHEIRALIDHSRLDGIVLAPPLSGMRNIVDTVRESGIGLVRIAPGIKPRSGAYVATNDRKACAEMTEYLASLGHRDIAFVSGHPDHIAVQKRSKGYRDGMRAAGLAVNEKLIVEGDNSIRSGEEAASILLGRKHRPTAIFCGNDDMAAGVLRVAHAKGIRVPDELSVAGFDDISLAQQIFPTMTTIRQPLAAMAEASAKLLIEQLNKGDRAASQSMMIPSTLVIRESTGPVPDKA